MTKEKKPLAIDEQSYLLAIGDLAERIKLAQYIADSWNANAILPKMDADHFWKCVNDFWHLENFYAETFAANMDTAVPGMGQAYLQQGNRAKPANYERARFQRICESITKPMPGSVHEFTGAHLIDWKEGQPFISPETQQALKDSYSAFQTAENAQVVELGKKLADLSNQLADAMQGHSKAMLPDGIVLPPQSTPRVIDYSVHQPGHKSQSPVRLDAIGGKYHFNPLCLRFGTQPIPAPSPPAPEKKPNPVIPLRTVKSGMHLQKIQNMY